MFKSLKLSLNNMCKFVYTIKLEYFQYDQYTFLLQNTVDKLVQRANASLLIGTSSWREQFAEALTVSPGKYIIYVYICMSMLNSYDNYIITDII